MTQKSEQLSKLYEEMKAGLLINMVRKTIGYRIKKVREEAGLTQYDFGYTLGLSREMVNALERDRFEPRVEILRAIKKKYKKPYDWLLDGKK